MKTPTGPITGGVYGLARLVSESASFQSAVGAADATAAEKSVKRWEFYDSPRIVQSARPFAAVWPANEMDLQQFAGGQAMYLSGSGGLILVLTAKDNISPAKLTPETRQESGDQFAEWVDDVITEIKNLSGVDDRLTVRKISLVRPVLHSRDWDDASTGAYWDIVFHFEWGF